METSARSTPISRWMTRSHLVATFAEVVVGDDAARVDEAQRRPIVVGEGVPDHVVVVERGRVVDRSFLRCAPHAVDLVLERELGRVDSDDDQPVVAVGLRPRTDVRLLAQPVDARPWRGARWPRSSAGPSGSELSHSVAPANEGMCTRSNRVIASAGIGTSHERPLKAAAAAPRRRSARPCRAGCNRRGWGTPARPSSAEPGRSRRRTRSRRPGS